MFQNRSKFALGLTGLATVLVLAVTTPANAEVPGPRPAGTTVPAPQSAALVSEGSGGGMTTMALPSGCEGVTDLPHKSQSFASVHSRTTCGVVAPMYVGLSLDRERWYGWEQMAYNSSELTRKQVSTVAKWYCSGAGTYTYRGYAYHRATINGTVYTNYTANQDRFAC